MRKFAICGLFAAVFAAGAAHAFQLQSTNELGRDDARNQNVVVRCTTDTGKVSNQTCSLRRYAKCSVNETGTRICGGWMPWYELRNPDVGYSDWRDGALACCRSKGLR